jgi:GntR family transcriptional regulator, rspAB operon transcriptional repressor
VNDDSRMAGQAYKAIKERVIDGRYRPGQRLSEARLVQDLGLGRSPIRAALAQLRSDGWISVSPQSGTYIRSLTPEEIDDLVDLRLLLETHAARFAARSISIEELRKLRRAFRRLCPRGTERIDENYFEEYNEFDSILHDTIYKAAGNALIAGILSNVLDKVQWLKANAPISANRIKAGFAELDRLLKALEARDPDAAATLMHTHISKASAHSSKVHRAVRATGEKARTNAEK